MPPVLQAIGLVLGVLLLAVFASNMADFARAILSREEPPPSKSIERLRLLRLSEAAAAQNADEDADTHSEESERAAATAESKPMLDFSRSALAKGMLWSFVLEAPRSERYEDGF